LDKNGGENRPEETRGGKKFFSLFKKFVPRVNFLGGNRLTIIEQDGKLCKGLSADFPQALVLNEDITDEAFIAEERIDNLDLIITATQKQELNIITAVYLKSRGVRRAIAMVTNPGYAEIARKLGIDVVISMKSVIVDTILTHLIGNASHVGVRGLHRLGDGSANILEMEAAPGCPIAGKPVSECRWPGGSLLMLVNRKSKGGGPAESFIPRGDTVLEAGDNIVLIAKQGSDADLGKLFAGSAKATEIKEENAQHSAESAQKA
jgi:trk system potassium uptake protein TrkA